MFRILKNYKIYIRITMFVHYLYVHYFLELFMIVKISQYAQLNKRKVIIYDISIQKILLIV